MRRRAARRHPTESIEDLSARKGDGFLGSRATRTDDLVGERGLVQRVREAIAHLEPAYRAALVLIDLEEMPSEQAAAILGVSPETARQRAHRARLMIRNVLAPLPGPALH